MEVCLFAMALYALWLTVFLGHELVSTRCTNSYGYDIETIGSSHRDW